MTERSQWGEWLVCLKPGATLNLTGIAERRAMDAMAETRAAPPLTDEERAHAADAFDEHVTKGAPHVGSK